MPLETQEAVDWALGREGTVQNGSIQRSELVDSVRQFFNDRKLEYTEFSAKDLDPYLNT